ncbi:Protein CC2D2B [Fukomys damarensis]|uniref:Protein CC2D2B n=1 Tax=Fukomys damarensis TaxID=885580 RepID=A0A091DWM9_FUKDA|nr:Protein CC2D2B [Fukomys damarensis]
MAAGSGAGVVLLPAVGRGQPTSRRLSDGCWYGIVLDAGSSHTNLYIYKWPAEKENDTGVVYQIEECKLKGPGISKYAHKLKDLETYLIECMEKSKNVVPKSLHHETPIYLGATAGMRLLRMENEQLAKSVLDEVSSSLSNYYFDFQGARIITGQEEGAYGWITINYLLGKFTQVSSNGILEDPCFHVGYKKFVNVSELYKSPCTKGFEKSLPFDQFQIQGIGNYQQCHQNILELFNTSYCPYSQCAFNGIFLPPLKGDFGAFSAFYFVMDFLNLTSEEVSSQQKMNEIMEKYCSRPWEEVRKSFPAVNEKFLSEYCFSGAYILSLLLQGYHFTDSSWKNIHFMGKVIWGNYLIVGKLSGSEVDLGLNKVSDKLQNIAEEQDEDFMQEVIFTDLFEVKAAEYEDDQEKLTKKQENIFMPNSSPVASQYKLPKGTMPRILEDEGLYIQKKPETYKKTCNKMENRLLQLSEASLKTLTNATKSMNENSEISQLVRKSLQDYYWQISNTKELYNLEREKDLSLLHSILQTWKQIKSLRQQQGFTSTTIKLQFQRIKMNKCDDQEEQAQMSEDISKTKKKNEGNVLKNGEKQEVYEISKRTSLLAKLYLPLPNNAELKGKTVLEYVEFSSDKLVTPADGEVGSYVPFLLEENGTKELCLLTSGKLSYCLSWALDENGIPLTPISQSLRSANCRNVDVRGIPGIPWFINAQKLFQWVDEVRIDPNNPEYSDLMEFIMYMGHKGQDIPQYFHLEQLQDEFNFVSEEEMKKSKRFQLLQLRNAGQLDSFLPQQMPLYDREIPDLVFQKRRSIMKKIIEVSKFNLPDIVADYEEIVSSSQLAHAICKFVEPRKKLKPQRKERRRVAAQTISDGDIKILIRILRAYNIPTRKTTVKSSPGQDYSFSNLSKIKDKIYINIFDEMIIEKHKDLIARFVSLIPFMPATLDANDGSDIWMTSERCISLAIGNKEEHAILLCNFFLYFGKKASVLLGTSLLEGHVAYVLTQETNECLLWNPSTGQCHKQFDPFCPLQSIDCLFDDRNVWFNVQQNNTPMAVYFDFSKESFWKQLLPKNFQGTKLQSIQITGFPVQVPYTDVQSVIDAVYQTGIHSSEFPETEFALAVYIHPYPNNILSVWVYLVSLTQCH